MAIEQTPTGKELIEATQNAIIQTTDSIADLIEVTAEDVTAHEAFYQHPTFWVGVSFVLVIALLGKPICKIVKKMLEARVNNIIKRISDAANLKDDAQKLLVEYERKFVNAEAEAGKILTHAQNEIELQKKEKLNKLKNEIAIKEQEVENRLLSAQRNALDEIANQTSSLTIKIVKEAITLKLDDKKQDELIDQSISKIANLK